MALRIIDPEIANAESISPVAQQRPRFSIGVST